MKATQFCLIVTFVLMTLVNLTLCQNGYQQQTVQQTSTNSGFGQQTTVSKTNTVQQNPGFGGQTQQTSTTVTKSNGYGFGGRKKRSVGNK